MKNNLLKTLVLGLMIFMFSCGDDTPDGSELSTCAFNEVSFTYNGVPWKSAAVMTNLSLSSLSSTLTGTITASTMDDKVLTINIFNPDAPDDSCLKSMTYLKDINLTTSDDRFQAYYSENVAAGTLFNAFSGSLTLDRCEGEQRIIEGTFNFQDETGDYLGTNGTFKVCLRQ